MAQGMGRNFRAQVGMQQIAFQKPFHRARCQTPAGGPHKNRRTTGRSPAHKIQFAEFGQCGAQISEEDWATLRSGKKVDNGYMKYVFNPLTFAVGTIYKFGPQGGGVSWRAGQAQYMPNLVIHYPETNAQGELTGRYPDWGFPTPPLPKGPATHWSATILNDLDLECGMYPAWLDGVEWEFLGASPAPSFLEKKHNVGFSHLRFCADDFGRLYVPAAHRNTIRLLDTAGNEIMRIGSYGNLDSGPTARLKTPHIPLCFPTATTLSKRYLYIVEARMPRILRVKMGYQQEDGGQVQVK